MPLVPIERLTAPSASQKKAIWQDTDKNGNTLMDLFVKKLSPDGKGTNVSIGPNEKTNNTIVTLGGYRIDLQKYNNDKSANFAIQTNGQNSVTLAALFMPPSTNFSHTQVENGFNMSLNSNGKSAFQLP
ncbi:hypothetical protein [Nodularia sp. NIES-3585]|uniref:hypothetical protein n=1 Tax=Nodularia sp. NIES-3585 TaxID=1973477 RepID=UPI000B5C70EB|nr:hypothetical protein [Nodularia sp. NIES-3585]GAX37053.1 hypothetical protein NIES3585_30930 [Nodularia sp. NIES-3585]